MTEPLVALHLAAAVASGATALAGAAIGLVGWVRARDLDRWLDRAVLALLVITLVASWIGLGLVASGPGPADALHLVYAVALLALVPATRAVAHRWTVRRRAGALAGAFAVSAVLVLRLAMTG